MSKKTKAPKCDSVKTWISWGKHAVESLRDKGVNLSRPSTELNRRVDAMVVSRAYAESLDKPKLQLRYEFSMELFLRKAGGERCDSFERSLPSCVEITKLFIPFADGSVILVQTPSEETVQCGIYLKMLTENPVVAELMGADGERLGALKEVVDLALVSNRCAALDAGELKKFMEHQMVVASLARSTMVHVNLAPEKIHASQALGILLDFLQSPTDTVTASVDAFITQEFGVKSNA